jgi:hypothetical protein
MRNFTSSKAEDNENYIANTLAVPFGYETIANICDAGFHYPDFGNRMVYVRCILKPRR